ncbi:MAG TPA: DUF4956 domain-containing protein [Vicinamibacterales bacterium]|jgi:hypothetical protein|nr:DUF4956 domain-containing protein [Vicinamibacterales bacterium]
MPVVPLIEPVVIAAAARELLVLATAAVLGAALGVVRPVRRAIVPRSAHVVQAQILLSIVGALIIIVVGENLARAFAIVGAAGLIRYRARIRDPKDAGVMLVALAMGLTVGAGMYGLAIGSCAFVIAVLWVLESIEPPARSRFELTIGGKDADRLKPVIEHALGRQGVTYVLLGSSQHELHYEVTVPFHEQIRRLTKLIRGIAGRRGTSVEWDIKKQKLVKP